MEAVPPMLAHAGLQARTFLSRKILFSACVSPCWPRRLSFFLRNMGPPICVPPFFSRNMAQSICAPLLFPRNLAQPICIASLSPKKNCPVYLRTLVVLEILPNLSAYPCFSREICLGRSAYPRLSQEIWPSLSAHPRFSL